MSDNNSTPCFLHLNDTNYSEWVLYIEAELIRKDLWTNVIEIVMNTKEKKDTDIKKEFETKLGKQSTSKMAKVQAEIILRVDNGQLFHML